jgi:hypothetical protein
MKFAAAAAVLTLIFAAGFVATGAAKVPGNGGKRHQSPTPTPTSTATTTSPSTTTATTSTGATTTTTAAPSPPPPSGNVLFRGDYDTGSFSQWDGHQWSENNDQGYLCSGGPLPLGDTAASIVANPVAEGADGAKFAVYPSSCSSSGQRAEVYTSVANTGGYEGQDWYYGWWTMIPSTGNTGWWSLGGDFNVITQFHGPGSTGAQEQFGVDATSGTPKLYFEVDTRQNGGSDYQKWIIANPLVYDHWYHYVAHIKWSTSSSGFVQVWQDGTEVVPLTNHQTLYPVSGASAYWKQGLYRANVNQTNTVYQDGAVRADTLAAAQG